MATVEKLLKRGTKRIRKSPHIDHWQKDADRIDAESFLESLVDIDDPDLRVPAAKARAFEEMVERRASGEPAARILGYVEFLDLRLRVREGAFFPRISSEAMALQARRRLRGRRRPMHLDLATGVGTVALAVASGVPRAKVFGVDILPAAVAGARANARSLGLRNATFMKGDLFEPLPRRLQGSIDVITIHPPYVGRDELEHQPKEIVDYEPVLTLTDFSPDGLGMVRAVAAEAPRWMVSTGWLLIEVATDMARKVSAILRREGYRDLSSERDPYGITRVVMGRRPSS